MVSRLGGVDAQIVVPSGLLLAFGEIHERAPNIAPTPFERNAGKRGAARLRPYWKQKREPWPLVFLVGLVSLVALAPGRFFASKLL